MSRTKWIVLPCALVAMMVVVLFAADLLGQKEPAEKPVRKASFADPSIVQLLADPERYHAKKVSLRGFLRVRFEDNALYLSKDDASHGIYANALWVNFDEAPAVARTKDSPPQPEDFDGKYVCLEGTFDMDDHGHLGLWNGAIGKVTKFYALKAVE